MPRGAPHQSGWRNVIEPCTQTMGDETVSTVSIAERTAAAHRYRGLKKWKKGQSGNPSGQKKGLRHVRDIAREWTPQCIERLGYWLLQTRNPMASVRAAEILLARGWGLPEQAITGADGQTLIPRVIVHRVERPGDVVTVELAAVVPPVELGPPEGIR